MMHTRLFYRHSKSADNIKSSCEPMLPGDIIFPTFRHRGSLFVAREKRSKIRFTFHQYGDMTGYQELPSFTIITWPTDPLDPSVEIQVLAPIGVIWFGIWEFIRAIEIGSTRVLTTNFKNSLNPVIFIRDR